MAKEMQLVAALWWHGEAEVLGHGWRCYGGVEQGAGAVAREWRSRHGCTRLGQDGAALWLYGGPRDELEKETGRVHDPHDLY